MASSVNKVMLIGNLGADPEIRTFQNGGRLASFSLATSESWKDKASGERKERTQWHRIVINNEPLIKLCEKYISKGSKLYIEGHLETRKYTDKDGIEKYTTEVVLRPYRGTLTMLDSQHGGTGHNNARAAADADADADDNPAHMPAAPEGIDDEIPF